MSVFGPDVLDLGDWLPVASGEPAAWPTGEVLLTGATGFFGAALLERLLLDTDARIVCLARGRDADDARDRVESALAARSVAGPLDRVTVLPGDLARPDLGLDDATWRRLAGSVDLVLHNGADVRWWGDVETIQATNIDSLRTLLRFAGTSRPKRVAFVSSLAIFNAESHADAEAAFETPPPPSAAGLRSPYVQSKWVGERLCAAAADRGVATTVLRVPYLLPDTRIPVRNPEGVIDLVIEASIALGTAPAIGRCIPSAPVDVCADLACRILAATANRPPTKASFHHLVPFETPTWDRILAAAAAVGHRLERRPADEWFELLRARSRDRPELRPAVVLVGHDPARTLGQGLNICRLRFDDAVTRSLLPDLPPPRRFRDDELEAMVRAIAADRR